MRRLFLTLFDLTHIRHQLRGPRTAIAVVAFVALAGGPLAAATQDEPPHRAQPPIENLGDERYRIGEIIVDKNERRLTVPGRILHLQDTLEYIAVTRGGFKNYESLLELDASAIEFKLACILIGLDEADSVKPRYQFDEREAEGQALDIHISWREGDEAKSIKAANALLNGEEMFDDHSWVYIGSIEENGELMAQTIGTLISFVHDPYAIIDHRFGVGVGNYGIVKGNHLLLPPEGAPVTVSVSAVQDKRWEETKQQ